MYREREDDRETEIKWEYDVCLYQKVGICQDNLLDDAAQTPIVIT